jgi:hypothetical protein
VLVEAERLECLLFLSTIRNFDGDELPVFEDACPVFCPKSIFAFVSRIDGGKGCYRQECSISGTKKRTGAGWLAWKDDPVAFCAETDERTKGVRGIEGC